MWSSLDRRFDPKPDAPAQARAFLHDALEPARGEAVDPNGAADATDAAVLLTSELATNVVRHAKTAFLVHLEWHATTLHVEVSDADPSPPVRRIPSDSGGGRGMQLLTAFADAWGSHASDAGKTVWFEVAFPGVRQVRR